MDNWQFDDELGTRFYVRQGVMVKHPLHTPYDTTKKKEKRMERDSNPR